VFSAGANKGANEDSRFMVDIGSMLSMLETASQKQAIVVGKPSIMAFEVILRDHFADLSSDQIKEILPQFLMTGDNLDSDILFANTCGIQSCLVFTGV
jgi:ribonucleotide monophosphatase NagD (HAD superfamily)